MSGISFEQVVIYHDWWCTQVKFSGWVMLMIEDMYEIFIQEGHVVFIIMEILSICVPSLGYKDNWTSLISYLGLK